MKRIGKFFQLPGGVCREIKRRAKATVWPEWKVVSEAITATKAKVKK